MSDDVISFRTPWTTTLESPATLERRLAGQRLPGEQRQVLAAAVGDAAHGIAIVAPAVAADGARSACVNDGFCALYGRGREEIIGQTPVAFGIVDRQSAISSALLQHVFEHRPF